MQPHFITWDYIRICISCVGLSPLDGSLLLIYRVSQSVHYKWIQEDTLLSQGLSNNRYKRRMQKLVLDHHRSQ